MKLFKIIFLCIIIACGNNGGVNLHSISDTEEMENNCEEESPDEEPPSWIHVPNKLCEKMETFCNDRFIYKCDTDIWAKPFEYCSGRNAICYEEYANAKCHDTGSNIMGDQCLGDTLVNCSVMSCLVKEYCYRTGKLCSSTEKKCVE